MRYSVGVEFKGTKITAGIVNEEGSIKARREIKVKEILGVEDLVYRLTQLIHNLLSEDGMNLKQIEQVGLTMPEDIEMKLQQIVWEKQLSGCLRHLVERLEQELGVQTRVEKYTNAAAWGEYMHCVTKPESMLYISFDSGIDARIVIDGKIYRGFNGSAGRAGHMSIQMDGYPCSCNRRGCWETYASIHALVLQGREAMQWEKDSQMWEMCQYRSERLDAEMILEAVQQKDIAACHVFEQYCRYVACGLVNIINLLLPELVIIGGELCYAGDLVLNPLRKIIQSEVYTRNEMNPTELCLSDSSKDSVLTGAAWME